ncbi:Cation/H(+) antiporter 28, partial [Ananas comosus]
IALLIAKVRFLRESFGPDITMILQNFGHYCFTAYMFALGLEMDPLTVFESPGSDTIIGYVSMLSTVVVGALFSSVLVESRNAKNAYGGEEQHADLLYLHSRLGLIAGLANTASPVLTRLTTELKISNTRVGRLAIGAGIHTDMVSSFLTSVGAMLLSSGYRKLKALSCLLGLIIEMALVVRVAKPIMDWISERNPEGKRVKGVDVAGVVVMILALCGVATKLHGDANMAVFLIGLVLPRQGRASRLLVNNINLLLSTVILPLYVCFVCLSLRNDGNVEGSSKSDYVIDTPLSWTKLSILSTAAAAGKVLGTLAAGRFQGLNWLESLALGLLLNIKGYYHVFFAYQATNSAMISDQLFVAILFTVLGTAMLTPLVGVTIAARSRRRAKRQLMGLQFLDPTSDVRIMTGLYAADNIPMTLNFIESVRWGSGPRGLTVYAIDMVEMTDRAAATLVKGDGQEVVTVGDESVVEFRKLVGEALVAYQQQDGNDGVKIQRLLAVSSFSDMHRDICSYAEDVLAVLIVLPFHKRQKLDGSMDLGHPGHRQVNQKVLQYAPCSVGILVDRGQGRVNKSSVSEATQNVVAIFIGGADDREALTLAARMSRHPGIELTVIRILPNAAARARASARMTAFASSEEEAQTRADDEYFTKFYERYVAEKAAGYVEKHVCDGAEIVKVLRSLESQYQLFIVGQGRSRNSVITDGLAEWAECPEIGPVGDILASSEFSVTASVLVVQQHDVRKRLKIIDEEFMPF